MNLIKETSRVVGKIEGYKGICDACGTPVEYNDELIAVEIENDEDKIVLVPIDTLVCPFCNKSIIVIRIWKSLEVSRELKELSK